MANSSDVVAGADAKASEYNNLRKDVIDTTTGHDHNGVNSCKLATEVITSYLSISPTNMTPQSNDTTWYKDNRWTQSNHATNISYQSCGIQLPHGAIVTSFKVYWYRTDALASGEARLTRRMFNDIPQTMAVANSNSYEGYHVVEDITIDTPTIQNNDICYSLDIVLNPNDESNDVRFLGAVITYTIASPFLK